MIIKDQINADFMEAYKAKNMEKKNFLGVLKGAIQTQEGKNIESTDENVLKVIKSLEKGINENIVGRKATGLDTDEQELELSYIKPYQPELMSEDIIREKVRLIILEVGKANLGLLMGTFNKENTGLAFDNKVVSNIIKEELV